MLLGGHCCLTGDDGTIPGNVDCDSTCDDILERRGYAYVIAQPSESLKQFLFSFSSNEIRI